MREAVRAFDIPCLEQAGFEADDLIATYVRQACDAGAIATIVASDQALISCSFFGVPCESNHAAISSSLAPDDSVEGRLRREYGRLTRQALAKAVDPTSPDYMNFTKGGQPLVDAAFLAQGLVRARQALVEDLDTTTRRQLVDALVATRAISPGFNNWLLFSATVEAALP